MSARLTLIVLLLLVLANSATAQQVRINGNRTPLRSEPTKTSTMLAYYSAGSALDIISFNDGWYRVRDPKTGQEGYILATLVDVMPGSKPVPATVESPAPPLTQPATKPIPSAPPPSKTTSRPATAAQPVQAPPTPTTSAPKPLPAPGTQVKPPATSKPGVQAKPKLGVRGIADVSRVWMTASESFKAVTDTSMRVQFGGGVQVVNLWKGLYAEAMVGRSSLDGSRVFVYQGTVYDLGIPVSITFTPIDAGGGWRIPLGKKKKAHAYAGGGATFMKYQEESDFADSGDNVDEVFIGFYASGGVEYSLTRWLHLRGEARFTSVPNALGAEGVSADFDETNLGGVAVAVKLAIGK